MKDTISLLIDPTPFDDEDARTAIAREMVDHLRAVPSTFLPPISSLSHNTGYLIEYPLYTSFPEMTITSERADLRDPSWTVLSIVNKNIPISSNPEIDTQVSIAYMCLLIVPIKAEAFKNGDTQAVYDVAELIVNQYIKLYKLIPYIHHHDLTTRNNTRSGLMAPVWKYELAPTVRLVGGESLLLNMGPATLLANQHPLTPQQQNLFLSGFNRDDWSEFHNVLYRLVKAYDFNCQALPFPDTNSRLLRPAA